MKVSLQIFRMSRKVVMIIGGVLLLSGAAGATALYIGKDRLLGPPRSTLNGLDCTSVQVIRVHRKDRYWIRKYIKTEPADGLTRVKTALRVASAVFEKEKPDLVQVVVLDSRGPATRSEIRGHAIGADVVYVPHPEKLASLEGTPVLQAKYTDGMATATGDFFGEKMMMPEEDASHLIASLSDRTDCIDPVAPEDATKAAGEGEGEGGKKKKEGGEGGKEAKPAGEAGAAPAEASTGEGEAKPAATEAKPAEGEAPVPEGEAKAGSGEGEAAAAAKPEGAAPEPKKGWFASVKSMVFGDKAAAVPQTANAEVKGAEAKDGAGSQEGTSGEEAAKQPEAGAGEGHDAAAKPKLSEAEQAAADARIQAAAEADARKQEDWLASIRKMVPADKVGEAATAEPRQSAAAAPEAPVSDQGHAAAAIPAPAAGQPDAPAPRTADQQDPPAPAGAEAQQDPFKPEGKLPRPPEKRAEGGPPPPPTGAEQPPAANPG